MFQIATAVQKYSPGVRELVQNFSKGIYEYKGLRWTVCGKVETIINALTDAGVFEQWMENLLWTLNDLAKESL